MAKRGRMCLTCKYVDVFEADSIDGNVFDEGAGLQADQGYCRRHAPLPRMAGEFAGTFRLETNWPIVDLSKDWCGEWAPREEQKG